MPVPSNHLSLVIDPTGINLRVFPDGDTPIVLARPDTNNQRSANGFLIAGGQPQYYDFSTRFLLLDDLEFESLYGLYSQKWALRSKGLPFETVIYNLAEPFVEIASVRSRRIVPGTSVIDATPIGSLTRFTYWIALQGVFDLEWVQTGKGTEVTFTFVEGTKLLA